jgi:hypothetical protein
MDEHFQTNGFGTFSRDPLSVPAPNILHPYAALPPWLVRRLLRAGEEITWVHGPRLNPWWERYITHPALFLVALALGAACLGVGRLCVRSWSEIPSLAALAGGGIVLGSVFVLGIAAGYFTRLVVTNFRIVILQGYEVCRSWSMDDLPPSLIRYRMRAGEKESRTVDLEALQTVLGGSSDQFAESKTILAFGKHLDQIKARDKGRP